MSRRVGENICSLLEFRQAIDKVCDQGHVVGMAVVLIFSDSEGRTYQWGLDRNDLDHASKAFAEYPEIEYTEH